VFVPDGPTLLRRPGLVHHAPAQSLGQMLANRRAALFLAVWFATNLVFGVLATPLGIVDASIAWEAHLGGFVVGLLLFPWFDFHGGAMPGR